MARNLCNNPWDKNLRQKVAVYKKYFNRLTRKKHRIFKNNLLQKIVDAEDKNPNEFWKYVDKLKVKVNNDPSSNISPNEWLTYFKHLMNIDQVNKFTDSSMNFAEFVENYDMQLLNSNITTEEVLKAAKSLKNGKAGGPDGILNEMLKISCIYNTTAYVNLFNTILKSGIYPELWRENYIKPIFKGWCFNDPSDYRGIALSSCFWKKFSKILSNRLDKFLIENDIICNEQIGFKKGCRTSDHILTLKCLIDKAFKVSKCLYVCFIDFKKAFDSVNRDALLYKMCNYKLTGHFFDIMKNMYKDVKYAIKFADGETCMFSSKVGVKQGCILESYTFFNIFKWHG